MSAIINSKVKPLKMRRMVAYAAVMGVLAFASLFYIMNYVV